MRLLSEKRTSQLLIDNDNLVVVLDAIGLVVGLRRRLVSNGDDGVVGGGGGVEVGTPAPKSKLLEAPLVVG